MTRSYTARWVLPVAGPPLPGGVLTIDGERISSVDPAGVRSADVDLGNAAIVPGLVNAHTHLDLSGARGLSPPTDPVHFTDWLRGVIAYRRSRSSEQVAADIRAGLRELLAAGTTLVGDISSGGASWELLAGAPVRAVVFRELIGLNEQRLLDAWRSPVPPDTDSCHSAISPHAPYSVNATAARRILAASRLAAVHLAESPAEQELLEHRRGPFVEFLQALGVYDPDALATSWTDFAVPANTLFVHANYLPLGFPFAPSHGVCYCPRTHAAFGHPKHPFRHFRTRGVRVCLGTDSLASNPDLDILAEASFLHARHPDFPGDDLLRMLTLAGAEALGFGDKCGSLEPGKSADFVVVPLPDSDGDPHSLLFRPSTAPEVRRTMYRGAWRGDGTIPS